MRDFESDFDFDFDDCVGLRAEGSHDVRMDSYRTVQGEKTRHSDNDERRARIILHTDRVQREMQELGISEGRFK